MHSPAAPVVVLAAFVLLSARTAPARHLEMEGPRLHASVPPLWSLAARFGRTLGLGAGLEWPLSHRDAVLLAWRGRQVDRAEDPWWAGRFRTRAWEAEAALRRYPWEWMPGFFVEGLVGYGRLRGENVDYVPRPEGAMRRGRELVSQETRIWEAAAGFGHLWRAGPVLLDLRFAFGPEWLLRTERDDQGVATRRSDTGSLLRFRDLALVLAF